MVPFARRSTQPLGIVAIPVNRTFFRRAVLGGGAVFLPLGIVAVYLLVSRQDLKFSVAGDYLALLAAASAGTLCVWHLAGPAKWRPTAMVIYPLVCLAALFMFTLSFLCKVFGECL